jgi:hypothetical protein
MGGLKVLSRHNKLFARFATLTHLVWPTLVVLSVTSSTNRTLRLRFSSTSAASPRFSSSPMAAPRATLSAMATPSPHCSPSSLKVWPTTLHSCSPTSPGHFLGTSLKRLFRGYSKTLLSFTLTTLSHYRRGTSV